MFGIRANNTSTMIEIQHLTFGYSEQTVLENLSLTIGDGEFCAIIGPNGSGKTTLLKSIARLIHGSGEILLDGKELATIPTMELAKMISYVPQKAEVVFDFSVRDTVMMGRNPHQGRWETGSNEDKRIIDEVLQRTGLEPLCNRMLSQLSGGEMQRVMIARAMAQQTPVMLLDEPLANLDISHKYEIMDLLAELNAQGTTIVIILHDFPFVKRYAQKTLMLKRGNIEAYGETASVMNTETLRRGFDLSEYFFADECGNVERREA